MEFFIECNPPKTTAQSATRIFKNKSTGSMFIGKIDKGIATRNELMWLLAPHRPDKPFENSVSLTVRWQYPYLKSVRKRDIGKNIPCTTRPDCDNISKFLCDCLTRCRFWTDDSQVAILHFEKFYSENAGIFIKIEEIL